MERWCQKINVHYFCFETALFGKIFGHMCKEKLCVPPPPPSGGWLRRKNCMPFPGILFHPPPLHANGWRMSSGLEALNRDHWEGLGGVLGRRQG